MHQGQNCMGDKIFATLPCYNEVGIQKTPLVCDHDSDWKDMQTPALCTRKNKTPTCLLLFLSWCTVQGPVLATSHHTQLVNGVLCSIPASWTICRLIDVVA